MSIHQVYQQTVKALVEKYNPLRVLKTDCWNESDGDFPVASEITGRYVVCLELQPSRIAKAQSKFPWLRFTKGDIRSIPFDDNEFDMVIDLSTIDHVEEYKKALNEYARVLIDDGVLYLVAWHSTAERDWIPVPDQWGASQYHFKEDEFMEAIPFKSISHGVFPNYDKGNRTLHWYEARHPIR